VGLLPQVLLRVRRSACLGVIARSGRAGSPQRGDYRTAVDELLIERWSTCHPSVAGSPWPRREQGDRRWL